MWPAIIAAAASLAGGIMGNKASAKEAEKNRDFQEEMSNSAFQRQVQDMRLAGINPMLAAKVGGASTPTGSQASQSDFVTPAVNAGTSAYNASLQTQAVKANVENTNADTVKKGEEAELIRIEKNKAAASAPLIEQQTATSAAQAKQYEAQVRLTDTQVSKVLEETAHIKSDRARVEAATNELVERVKKYGLDRSFLEAGIMKIREEVFGTTLHNQRAEIGVRSDEEGLRQLTNRGFKIYNEAVAEQSAWKRNVSPYLSDVGSAANSAGSLLNLFGGGARFRRR